MAPTRRKKKGPAWRRLRKVVVKSPIGRRVSALTDRWRPRAPSREPLPESPARIAEENHLFAADVIRAGRVASSLPATDTTYAEDVIKFFGAGIRRPMFQSYVSYALHSLARGENLVARYVEDDDVLASYLDVGCAYGGAPIAMARRGVARTVGFEYDKRLLVLANKLAKEHGVSASVEFKSGDLTSADDVRALGSFDLTTCIDVLEHVLDPEAAIANLALLAGATGTVIVDVPNPRAYQTIERDPHHHLFGSALLERDDAIAVFEQELGGKPRYTVGYYHPLEWYLERLESAGFDVTTLDEPSHRPKEVATTLARVEGLRAELDARSTQWPSWRRDLVGAALEEFYREAGDIAALASRDPLALQLRHAQPVFHLRCELAVSPQ